MDNGREMSTEEYEYNQLYREQAAVRVMAALTIIGMVIALVFYAIYKVVS
jgi:hypothetical protein